MSDANSVQGINQNIYEFNPPKDGWPKFEKCVIVDGQNVKNEVFKYIDFGPFFDRPQGKF